MVGAGSAVAARVLAASILPVSKLREIKAWLVMRSEFVPLMLKVITSYQQQRVNRPLKSAMKALAVPCDPSKGVRSGLTAIFHKAYLSEVVGSKGLEKGVAIVLGAKVEKSLKNRRVCRSQRYHCVATADGKQRRIAFADFTQERNTKKKAL